MALEDAAGIGVGLTMTEQQDVTDGHQAVLGRIQRKRVRVTLTTRILVGAGRHWTMIGV